MTVNTKPLEGALARAELRLENIKSNARWVKLGSALATMDVEMEIGILYNLLIEIGKAVNELQKEANRG